MKRLFPALLVIMALIFSACVGSPGGDAAIKGQIHILHFNDFHGKLEADSNGQAGIATMAAYIKAVRAQYPDALVLSAGDFNTGSMVSDKYDGLIEIEVFNKFGLDATVLGNHEFDKSPEALKMQMDKANFPFLSANIYRGNANAFQPYIVKKVGKIKVGIFGLTTSDTPVKAHPLKVAEYDFHDEIETARQVVTLLRSVEKVDMVIGLFHTGYGEGAGPNPSDKIAEAVPGIDLIIDGHSHSDFLEPLFVAGTPIVQASNHGEKVGHVVLNVGKNNVELVSWDSVPMNLKNPDGSYIGTQITPDQEISGIVKKYVDEINAKYATKIADTTGAFEIGDRLPRRQETALGDLVADSMVWKARQMGIEADFALMNGGGIRATIPAGAVTRKHAFEVLPFGNTMAYFAMSGVEVAELFENVGAIPQGNGGWAVISGDARYTIDLGKKTTRDITIGGKPIDPDRMYIVITNDFLAVGGDGMYPVFDNLKFIDTYLDVLEGLVEYMQAAAQPLAPKTDGRLTLVP